MTGGRKSCRPIRRLTLVGLWGLQVSNGSYFVGALCVSALISELGVSRDAIWSDLNSIVQKSYGVLLGSDGQGPSWEWMRFTVGSGVGAVFCFICTILALFRAGYLQ